MEGKVITKSRISALAIALTFVFSSLVIPNIAVKQAGATATGDTYAGSGDWVISNPTTYTSETLTVYGNITVNAPFYLVGTMLTIDQPAALARSIYVGASGNVQTSAASWIGSTNQTDGHYNTEFKVNGGGFLWAYGTTFDGIWFNINSVSSYFVLCVMYGCGIWNNYGLGWETGEPLDTGPLGIVQTQFLNTNTTGMTYTSLIVAGNDLLVEDCTFTNITLAQGAADACSIIRDVAQNGVQVHRNTFASSRYAAMYFHAEGTYTMAETLVYENHLLGIGGTYALLGYGIFVKDGSGTGGATNCTIRDNTFGMIRNGSKGIYVTESNWQVDDNTFEYLDSSGLTSAGSTNGIWIGPPGESTFDGNRFDRLVGPGADTGASCIGIISQSAGGFTVSHSVIQNLSYLSCAISVVDPLWFAGLPDILIHANSMSHMTNASGGIAIFGGHDAVVSWNNMSDIDGSSVGVMFDGTAHHGLVHNNSVVGLHGEQGGFVWPDGWQIVVGAYTYYAGGSTEGPIFKDNHAAGELTAKHPAYNITGEKLGGGWWPNARMTVDTSESTVIHCLAANLTLTHDDRALMVFLDGTAYSMSYYANGSSWASIEKTDLLNHFVNVTVTSMTVDVADQTDIKISAWDTDVSGGMQWTANSSVANSTTTYTITGLKNSTMYDVSIDSALRTYVSNATGVLTFTYAGSSGEHSFEVGDSYLQQLTNLIWPLVSIGIIFMVLSALLGLVLGSTGGKAKK